MSNTPQDGSIPQDAATIAQYQKLLAESAEAHADYHAWMDSMDPYTASRSDMIDLMESAPSPVVKGMLWGIFTMRIQMAAVTGRAYE